MYKSKPKKKALSEALSKAKKKKKY